jgi:hypothetical protein
LSRPSASSLMAVSPALFHVCSEMHGRKTSVARASPAVTII